MTIWGMSPFILARILNENKVIAIVKGSASLKARLQIIRKAYIQYGETSTDLGWIPTTEVYPS
jgi:hypothetical protein